MELHQGWILCYECNGIAFFNSCIVPGWTWIIFLASHLFYKLEGGLIRLRGGFPPLSYSVIFLNHLLTNLWCVFYKTFCKCPVYLFLEKKKKQLQKSYSDPKMTSQFHNSVCFPSVFLPEDISDCPLCLLSQPNIHWHALDLILWTSGFHYWAG